jgi:hypothetical protein
MAADLDALMGESPDTLVSLKPQGRDLHWSRSARAIVGLGNDKACDCPSTEFVECGKHAAQQGTVLDERLSGQAVPCKAARPHVDGRCGP